MSCKFQTELADLVYLVYENMGSIKPSLGDIHVLLSTSVKADCAKQIMYMSLVPTTTHVGLLKKNNVFFLHPTFWLLHASDHNWAAFGCTV